MTKECIFVCGNCEYMVSPTATICHNCNQPLGTCHDCVPIEKIIKGSERSGREKT